MTEKWFIFRDRETGQELGGYTMQGTFPGERAATIELIAAEKGIPAERIETIVETRTRNADPYSMEQWRQDGTFNAEPGQEITEDVYSQMLNGMPPLFLSGDMARKFAEQYKHPIQGGYLMGEPQSTDADGRNQYLAFGLYGKGNSRHYFYLGLSPRR